MHAGALVSKKAVNLSVQMNPQFSSPSMQAGMLCSEKMKFDWAACSLT